MSEKRKEYSFQNDIFSTIFALLNKSRERQQPGKCIGSNTEYIYHSGIFWENKSGDEIVLQIPEKKKMYFIKLDNIKNSSNHCLLCYTNSQNLKIIKSKDFIDKKSDAKIVCQIAELENSSKHFPICYTNSENWKNSNGFIDKIKQIFHTNYVWLMDNLQKSKKNA